MASTVTAGSEDEFHNFSDEENDADNDESSDTASASENDESNSRKVKVKVEQMEGGENRSLLSSMSNTLSSQPVIATSSAMTTVLPSSHAASTSVSMSQGGSNDKSQLLADKVKTEQADIKTEPDSANAVKAEVAMDITESSTIDLASISTAGATSGPLPPASSSTLPSSSSQVSVLPSQGLKQEPETHVIEDDDSSATCSADEGTAQDDLMFHPGLGSRALPGSKGLMSTPPKLGSGDKVTSSDDKKFFSTEGIRINNRQVDSSSSSKSDVSGGIDKVKAEEDGGQSRTIRDFAECLSRDNRGVNNIRDLIDSAIDKHLG